MNVDTSNDRAVSMLNDLRNNQKKRNAGYDPTSYQQIDPDLELTRRIIEEVLGVVLKRMSDATQITRAHAPAAVARTEYAAAAAPATQAATIDSEAVAEELFDFAMTLFSKFKSDHPEIDPTNVIGEFVGAIKTGFEQGFTAATGQIEAAGAMTQDLQDGLTKMRDIFLAKMDAFQAQILNEKKAAA